MFAPIMAGSPPTTFQTYLARAIPFRRRQSSGSTTSSTYSRQTASIAASPPTPLTPLSPTGSFFASHHSSTTSYDFTAHSPTPETPQPAHPHLHTRRPSYLTGHAAYISCTRCHADLALTSQIISKGFTGRHGRAYLVAASPSPLISAPASGTLPSSAADKPPPSLPNTNTHKSVPRHLVTGMHTVADISCAMCGSVLGWKYVAAEEDAQRYKVGKFILETRRVCVGVSWEVEGSGAGDAGEEDEEGVFGVGDLNELFGCGAADGRPREEGPRRVGGAQPAGGSVGKGKVAEAELDPPESGPTEAEEIAFDSQDEDECDDLFAGIWSPALARRRRRSRGLDGVR